VFVLGDGQAQAYTMTTGVQELPGIGNVYTEVVDNELWALVMKLSKNDFCYGSDKWKDGVGHNLDKMLDATMPANEEYDAKSLAFHLMEGVTELRFVSSGGSRTSGGNVTVSFSSGATPENLMTTNDVSFERYPDWDIWKAAFGSDRNRAPVFVRAGEVILEGSPCRSSGGIQGCGQPCMFCMMAGDGGGCPTAGGANDIASGLGGNAAYCSSGAPGSCSASGQWANSNNRVLVWALVPKSLETTTTTTTAAATFTSSILKFGGPNALPSGWTFASSDPTTQACNSFWWGSASSWVSNANNKLLGVVGITVDGTDLDWRADVAPAASYNGDCDNDIIFHFCSEVTIQQVLAVPWHQGHPLQATALQYKDSSGAWQDSGAAGAAATGYGLWSSSENSAQYWTYGPASSASKSKYWRVQGMQDTTVHKYSGGVQITVGETAQTQTGTIPTEGLVFSVRASQSSANSIVDSVNGMTLAAKPVITHEGQSCWDLDNTWLEKSGGPDLQEGQFYTHAVWVYWRSTDSGWRTLMRPTPSDHSVLIENGKKSLGMYSNRAGGFKDSGYDIAEDMSSWQLVVVTGSGSSSTSSDGESKFYTAAAGEDSMTYRGSTDKVVSGNKWYRLGWSGQGPGKVAAAYEWNRVLSEEELAQLLQAGVDKQA
jgi:hypothetical protein